MPPVAAALAPSDDWSHVLNVLAAARDEPATASTTAVPPQPPQAPVPHGDDEHGAARWNEVLELLANAEAAPVGAAGGGSGGRGETATKKPEGGQIDTLFSGFGMPQQAPAFEQASEEVRAQVLQETLARLLQQKSGATAPVAAADAASGPKRVAPPPRTQKGGADAAQTEFHADAPLPGMEEPDWRHGGSIAGTVAPRREGFEYDLGVAPIRVKPEGPLDKFIRVFGLDELAAKCLRALEDDEAAFVIESCQGRLAHAPNPSAVTMIAIKGVAARVGRRYYGSRYSSELQRLLEQHSGAPDKNNAPLQIIMGSPAPADSPEADEEEDDEEEEEEEEVSEPEVEISATDAVGRSPLVAATKRPRVGIAAPQAVKVSEPSAKRVKETVIVASPEPENEAEEEDDGLFFVDTGA